MYCVFNVTNVIGINGSVLLHTRVIIFIDKKKRGGSNIKLYCQGR